MDIVHPDVDRYLNTLSSPHDDILREMEFAGHERSFPIVGPQVGRLLHLLARASRARRIIELGSGFGYSAYWFAMAVGESGQVVLTEHSEENLRAARDYLSRGGLADRCRFEHGDALDVLHRIGGEFDVVFNDIDKERYPEVAPAAAAALRHGGLLVSDNMLWYGTVLEEDAREATTEGVRRLTRELFSAPEWFSAILPIRDGVTISIRH